MRPLRRDIQMIFQDPYSSLNPRHTVGKIVGAPFKLQGVEPEGGRKKAVQELLSTVGLSPEHYNRYPHEFSGGQRQRIGIARTLALKPKLIVADEPVSALDVSIQAQVVNLLEDLQEELDLTYVMIAHDLSVVRHVSDRVAVMYLGKIVEIGDRDDLYDRPRHPYTVAMLSAVPVPDTKRRHQRERIRLEGDVPSPINPPPGLPLPHPLLEGPGHLQDRGAPAAPDRLRPRHRPPGRLPLPGGAAGLSGVLARAHDHRLPEDSIRSRSRTTGRRREGASRWTSDDPHGRGALDAGAGRAAQGAGGGRDHRAGDRARHDAHGARPRPQRRLGRRAGGLGPLGTEHAAAHDGAAGAGRGAEAHRRAERRAVPKKPGRARIQLDVSPVQVGPMERVNLTGTYRGGDNVRLEVQRYEDGTWTNFGVDATVRVGTFTDLRP